MCFLTLVSLFVSMIKTVLSNAGELLNDESLLERTNLCVVLNQAFEWGHGQSLKLCSMLQPLWNEGFYQN